MKYKTIFFIIFYAGVFSSNAMSQNNDTELWGGINLDYNLTRSATLEFEQQLRFNNNISSYNFTYSELGLNIGVTEQIAFAGKYRYSFIEQEGTGITSDEYDRYRYSFDFYAHSELINTAIEFAYRMRFQDSREKTTNNEYTFIRNRFRLKYKMNIPVHPYVSFENFFQFNNLNIFDRNRYTAGVDWSIMEKLNFLAFYRIQKEVKTVDPRIQNIIGLSLNYAVN